MKISLFFLGEIGSRSMYLTPSVKWVYGVEEDRRGCTWMLEQDTTCLISQSYIDLEKDDVFLFQNLACVFT